MASIIDKILAIRNAVLGKDVRESIASGIESINIEVESTTNKQDILASQFDSLIINAGASNAEIVVAHTSTFTGRNFDSIGQRVDNVDEQLADNALQLTDILSKYIGKYSREQALNFAKYIQKVKMKTSFKVACLGNSLTYGHDTHSSDIRPAHSDPTLDVNNNCTFTQASITYPEALQQYLNYSLGTGVATVVNRGYSGDDVNTAYARWTINPNADLTIIKLGKNDVDNMSIVDYVNGMCKLIQRNLDWGSAIMLVVPLKQVEAVDLSGINPSFNAFSEAVFAIGKMYDIPVLDGKEFLTGYNNIDVYGPTEATHLNGVGYSIIAAKIFSTILNNSPYNPNIIKSGRDILLRESRDSLQMINTTITLFGNSPGTEEWIPANAFTAAITSNGRITHSFFTDEENLIIVPIFNVFGTSNAEFSLDRGVIQPKPMLTTKVFQQDHRVSLRPSSHITFLAGVNRVDKDTVNNIGLNDIGINCLHIAQRGWHTIDMQNTGGDSLYLFGYLVLSFEELYNRHMHLKMSAIPTTGVWRLGDIIYNLNPVSAGYLGWVCITGGTPGTWKQFGLVA